MEFVQRGGSSQTSNPNFFDINFGSKENKIWGRSQGIDTYFWIQTLGGSGGVNKNFERNLYFHFFLMKTSLIRSILTHQMKRSSHLQEPYDIS